MRRAVQPEARQAVEWATVPAPVRGLMLNRQAGREDPSGATVLENWFSTNKGARVRGGLSHEATADADIVSMFRYNHPSEGALFAATATAIADITGLNPSATATNVVTGQTAGYYSTAQIGTTGDVFLYAVNGADEAQLFDGSTWLQVNASSSPQSITGVATDTLSQVWLFKNRLFFVQKDTATAWYLPVDSAGGAAQSISLAGVFQRGGSLLFGATWSSDSGDGQDDRCVFVSTDGEIAIYEGTNPSEAAAWSLVGRYDTARPLGINATMKSGGDLVIATVEGMIPLSQAVQKDPAALSLAAVTRNIEPLWAEESRRAVSPWEVVKWSARNIGLVTVPDANGARLFAVNLLTGAWTVQTGWDAKCASLHNEKLYIAVGPKVLAIDEGGTDDGAAFFARYCGTFLEGAQASTLKKASLMRVTAYATGDFGARYSVASDYQASFPQPPQTVPVPAPTGVFVWDQSRWGQTVWGGDPVVALSATQTINLSVAASGYTLAPTVQIASNSTDRIDFEMISVTIGYEEGGALV